MNNKETLINHIEEHPKLRFKDIDGIDFPDWIEKHLYEIGNIVTGNTPSTKILDNYGNDYLWVTPTDIEGKEIYKTNKKLSHKGYNVSRKIPANSLLVTCIASIGKNCILREDGSCNQQINAITPNSDYDVDFLYYLIAFNENLLHKESGTGQMEILNKQSFSELEMKFPSLPEQQKIASFLSLIDENIEKQELKLILLNKYKRGLLFKIFTSFNRDNLISLKELIDKNVIEIKRGNIIPKQYGIYPVYSSSVHNNGLFCYSDNYMFDEELVSWSIDGGGNFFYRPKHKFSLTNVSGYIRVKDKNILNTQYLYYNLDYSSCNYNFDYQNKALPSYISKLYQIYLLDIKIQNKVSTILSSFDFIIKKEEQILLQLKQYKQGLLQQMFI